jgi:hypothetical protein
MSTIADLRKHLFAALEGLSDNANPMSIDRAKAVADVAQVLINSAKVEVEFIKATKGKGTGFIAEIPGEPSDDAPAPDAMESTQSAPSWPAAPVNGIRSITQHVMKG